LIACNWECVTISAQLSLQRVSFDTLPLTAALWVLAPAVHAHGDSHADEPDVSLNIADVQERVFATVVRDAPTPQINPAVGGQWSDVYDWPLVAIHAALLPNGKVLAWDATPDDADDDPHTTDNSTTRVTLWDPISNTHVQTNNDTDTDLFCAGSAHLWDGRILFAGGDGARAGANGPLSNSNIYNPVTNTWHRTENMHAPRWYSSVAALSNGEMLTLGGSYEPVPLGEVFQFDQTWRPLSGTIPAPLTGDYQWLQQTPEGSVLYFGPADLLVDIDTDGQGTFTPQTTRDAITDRDYGSYAMYEPGKILVAGGAQGIDSAVIIDTATKQTVDTNPLLNGRRQHNLTILADGSVLATGGNDDGARFFSPTASVLQPEIWDPETEIWTAQNTIPSDRQYHSIALLLPDGQVLSAGGAPYLFNEDGTRATRPRITSAPDMADYSEQVTINLSDSINISKAHLIKLGSVTHSENQDQRLVPMQFTRTAGRMTLQMPDSRHAAPPGHYLLFVVDSDGVPSLGSMLKLGQPLIGSRQLTNTTLELDVWDTYLTEPVVGQANIELIASAGTQVFVSDTAAVRSATQADVLCSSSVDGSGIARCVLNNVAGSQLHISVSGSERTDYSLMFTDNTAVTVETPIPPVVAQNPDNTDSSSTDTSQFGDNTEFGENTESLVGITPIGDTVVANNGVATGTSAVAGTSNVRTGVGAGSHFWLLVMLYAVLIRLISHRNWRV